MLSDLISAYGSKFLVAALGVSLALLCLFIVLWVLRNRAPSPFVRGGRNRQPRLQVLDAAAIDARRRIVLIRRDNVEHLVMIGGPTDLVIEAGIGDERHYLTAQALQSQAAEDEARLAHQVAASLPAAEAGSSAPLARDNRFEATASMINREEQPAPRPQASEPTARPPVQTAQPIAAKVENAASRPSTPIAATSAAKVNVAPPPIAPVVAATTAAATVVAAQVTATPQQRPSAVTEASAPPLESRYEPAPTTTDVSAIFSAELDAALNAEEMAPAIVLDRPAEAPGKAPGTPVAANVADRVLAPPTTDKPERPADAPSLAQPQEAPLATAPLVELGQSPRTDLPTAHDAKRSTAVAPSVTPNISSPLAEEVLDAARARVLTSPVSQGQVRPFDADRFLPDRDRGVADDVPPAPHARDESMVARELSDFERVLEDEMALHIAADAGPPRPQPSPATQIPALMPDTRPDRPRLPLGTMVTNPRQSTAVAGTNPAQQAEEPNLQNEIARIFGEMSASRNP